MKIVVIGGSGLIGTKVVSRLRQKGHDVVAASPRSGVNTVTGIKASGVPYTIVRATQFFEFMGAIAQAGTVGQTAHLSPALFQPIASDDVAEAVADVAFGVPVNGTIEIAGPDRAPIDKLVGRFLSATHDPRKVVADAHAGYFGIAVNDQSLTPGDKPRLGRIRFEDWLSRSVTRN